VLQLADVTLMLLRPHANALDAELARANGRNPTTSLRRLVHPCTIIFLLTTPPLTGDKRSSVRYVKTKNNIFTTIANIVDR
jgi:hypothetical protein